ncbi:hypothetical protein [Chitinophaga sp. CF418]|uniref:hypothetical protein n=1 Tax=Chitinophaga sp. CF418 TaxID=1855287 RepID=UPI000917C78F|nr:hypothetical protein [Chitinophaga sp. CF418]SHN29433.1 hypothetical protein SAMN05216311_108202 [Chitinophaga sp. CF418]
MEIKSRFSNRRAMLLTFISFIILIVLVRLGYIQASSLLIGGLVGILGLAKPDVSSVAVNEAGITLKWSKYFIERTLSRPLDNISLEIIYSGSTGKPKDAILNVFEGTKCIHQVYATYGFTEDDFRKFILAFNDLKTAARV